MRLVFKPNDVAEEPVSLPLGRAENADYSRQYRKYRSSAQREKRFVHRQLDTYGMHAVNFSNAGFQAALDAAAVSGKEYCVVVMPGIGMTVEVKPDGGSDSWRPWHYSQPGPDGRPVQHARTALNRPAPAPVPAPVQAEDGVTMPPSPEQMFYLYVLPEGGYGLYGVTRGITGRLSTADLQVLSRWLRRGGGRLLNAGVAVHLTAGEITALRTLARVYLRPAVQITPVDPSTQDDEDDL